jgi:hypothetical protein
MSIDKFYVLRVWRPLLPVIIPVVTATNSKSSKQTVFVEPAWGQLPEIGEV